MEVALRRRHLVCPVCGHRAKGRFDTRPLDSAWRHLDLGIWRLEICARLRRLRCPIHGARTEAVPFARRFKGARWALMKKPENLSETQTATLRQLRAAGGEVWRAYTLKEALRAIFAPGLSIDDVELLIDRFISRARRSRLESFVKLAATITKHREGILAAVRLGVTNARAEALNNKVRLIVRRAYGFHSADAALALIHLTCGPIELTLPHEPNFA